MADELSALGQEDLDRLLEVIESLEHSTFDFLQLEIGDMKVVLGKGDPALYVAASPASPASPVATGGPPTGARPSPAPQAAAPAWPAASALAAADRAKAPAEPVATGIDRPGVPEEDAGTVVVRAPMMGIFYAQPEPGAPPYVTVGTTVDPDTTLGLVEVMKMFNAVSAGVRGTVTAVLVETNQLVEYDQPLFVVRLAEDA